MVIDFIKEQGKTEKIDEALDKMIKGELKEIRIINIPSGNFIDMYDVDDITDFNGWQCDWWSKMHYEGKTLNIMGEAFYGIINISNDSDAFEDGDDWEDDDDEEEEEE